MTIWLSSDHHMHHKNVITLCNRPFSDVIEMHKELIKRHNEIVQPDDICYFLGDFSFGGITRTTEIAKQLLGIKKIIRGNHDRFTDQQYLDMGFAEVYCNPTSGKHYIEIEHNNRKILLSHYPYAPKVLDGEDAHNLRYMDRRPVDTGEILLHGHVHNCWRINGLQFNVGCDVNEFRPVSLDSIIKELDDVNKA